MEQFNLTAAGLVCINFNNEMLLIKKEYEAGWGFTGGKVIDIFKETNEYDKLFLQAITIHQINTGTSIIDMKPFSQKIKRFGLILDYVETSKKVRLVHFLVRVPNNFLDIKGKKAKHRVLRFFTIDEIKEMESADILLPNVIKVIKQMEIKKLL